MEKIEIGKSPFSQVDHVGIVVKNLDQAVAHYESLGVGPFEPLVLKVVDRSLRGKPINDLKIKVKMANVKPIKFELIEPVSGTGSIWQEFLDRHGDGLMHIAFHVDDIEKEVALLTGKGYKILYSARFADGGGGIYFETDQDGGALFELTTV
jgi:methylmalonyl-CoA/ethylmalonyl-CoA epimerase